MWSFTLNRNFKVLITLVLSLTLFAFTLSSCSSGSVNSKTESGNNNESSQPSDKSLFSIDVSLKKEFVSYDSETDTIYAYFRMKHNILPLQSEKNVLAGNLTISDPEPLSDFVYRVRICGAPSEQELKSEDIKSIKFGPFKLAPTKSIKTGFNEMDIYGSGAFDLIVELAVKPEEEIGSDAEAEKYLKDLCYDKKIGFSYAIYMDRPDNKQLYRKVEIKVPEKVFDSNAEIFLFAVKL